MTCGAAKLRQTAFGMAYRMLGDAIDAEDIAQNCAEKFMTIDWKEIDNPHAYVAKMSARKCLNTLRKQQVRKRHDENVALPLPHLSEQNSAADARLDLSYGIVVLSQKLSPLSRAVFIMRNAFDLSFAEIAEALERSPGACRQAYNRGKKKMCETDATPALGNAPVSAKLIGELSSLIIAGDIANLKVLLSEEIVLHSDGGGVAPDLGRPVMGLDRIARFLVVSPHLLEEEGSFRIVETSQGAMLLVEKDGKILLLVMGETSDLGISALYAISDPVKLERLRQNLP